MNSIPECVHCMADRLTLHQQAGHTRSVLLDCVVNRQLHALALDFVVTSRHHAPFILRSWYVYKLTVPTGVGITALQGCFQTTGLLRLYVSCRTRRLGQDILRPLSPAKPTEQYRDAFLLSLKSLLMPVTLRSNDHSHSLSRHRPVPLVLHLPSDPEEAQLQGRRRCASD